MAGLHGNVGVRGQVVPVSISAGDLLKHLDIVLPLRWTACKPAQSYYVDLLYLRVSNAMTCQDTPSETVQAQLKELILETAYGIRLNCSDVQRINALIGVRFWDLSSELDYTWDVNPSAQFSGSKDWVDPIIGVDDYLLLNRRLVFAAQADIGGFGVGSHFSWQLYGGLKYTFSHAFMMGLEYRALYVDYTEGGFTFDTTTEGPVITFDFTY